MPERLNENAYLSFPLVEDQIMKADTGEEIPTSLLLDFSADLYLPTNGAPRITSLSVDPGGTALTVTFTIPFVSGDETRDVLVPAGVSEWFVVTDLVSSQWSAIVTFGEGVNDLCADYAGQTLSTSLEFEPSRVAYVDNHVVRSLSNGVDVPLVGDVKIKEGYNLSVSVAQASNKLTLSASKGGGSGVYCGNEEEEETGDCADLLYEINGLTPDWFGNFGLSGGPGITVTPVPEENKIVISTSVDGCKAGCRTNG